MYQIKPHQCELASRGPKLLRPNSSGNLKKSCDHSALLPTFWSVTSCLVYKIRILYFITCRSLWKKMFLIFDILIFFSRQKWGTNKIWRNPLPIWVSQLTSASDWIKSSQNGQAQLHCLASYLKRRNGLVVSCPPLLHMKEEYEKIRNIFFKVLSLWW